MSTKRISLIEVLLWLIVLLLVLLVLSPIAMGFKIQSEYPTLVSNISKTLQADVKIVNFNRGLFGSNAVLEFRVPEEDVTVQFKENIIHGPIYLGLINQSKSPFVAAVVQGEMMPISGLENYMQQIFAGKKAFVYQNVINYSGDVFTEEYVPAINATLELDTGPVQITSSGISGNWFFSSSSQTLSGEFTMPGISVGAEGASLVANNLNMSFSANKGQSGLLLGDSNLSLKKLDIQSKEDQFTLHDFRVRTVNSEVGQLINSFAQIDAREIYASNERFGPVTFNLSINGLNAASLKQMQDMQDEIQMKTDQGVPPEQINAMVAGQMIGLVPDLIKQMDMKIDPFKIESELGKLETTLDFSVEGLDQNAPADPMFMMSAVNLDINLGVDEPLMRQFVEWYLTANEEKVEAMGDEKTRQAEASVPMDQKVTENLQGLVDENWLTYNEGVYSSSISLHQGQMMLNDKAVDPMRQLMSQMAPPGGAGMATQ